MNRTTSQRQEPPRCEHGLPLLTHDGERMCALDYLNRFVAPNQVEQVRRRGARVYLAFSTGEALECCCEDCGSSHGTDKEFVLSIKEMTGGRRALRFRVEEDGHLVIWFARGDTLHLHRNSLVRFRPARRKRTMRPHHS